MQDHNLATCSVVRATELLPLQVHLLHLGGGLVCM
jgi:hypothetical protein